MTAILSRKQKNKGFTLLEIIISLGLITTALLAVFQLQAQNLDLQSEAQFITIANQLTQDRLSRIQSKGSLEAGTSSGDFGDDFPHFIYQEEIMEIEDIENLFKVKVSILFEKDAALRDLSVETYLYREKI